MNEPSTSLRPHARRAPLSARTRRARAVLAAGCSALIAACSGGSGSGGLGSSGGFILEGASVSSGQTWQINRPIRFDFSQPIDFSSVSMNTVSISQIGGGPAVGDFLLDATRPASIVFQPTCPTQPDFSDAGLVPGGVQYRIDIPTSDSGATTLRSTSGQALSLGTTLVFFTPLSELPSELFLDVKPGPPSPLPGEYDSSGQALGTRLVFLDGSAAPIPFVVVDGVGQLPLSGDMAGGDFEVFPVPLNLYSDISSRFKVVMELDQPVNPTSENINQNRVQFQYLNAGQWVTFGTTVTLSANCTASGATVELAPQGVLPQNREMRVLLSPEFEDIVGDRNILPLDSFATMQTRTFTDASGMPIEYADEFLESFLIGGTAPGSFEDTDTVFATPRANWGGGELEAAFAFDGTGGPGGDFDWHVTPNSEFVLDTTSSVILGGPNGVPTTFQVVVNGVVDLRNLFVPASSTIRIQGPNPAFFQCSGSVRIDGAIKVNGGSAQPVFTLNTPTQPEAGAAGNGGGGDGGTGSPQTTQVTTRGGPGNGAFNAFGAGGQGGESGWSPDSTQDGANRRAAGGGGGSLGLNVQFANGCLDQTLVGLDAESGFPGATAANAAERPGEVMPWGGREATRPFNDFNGTDDDFFGVKRKDFGTNEEVLIQGELISAWAGSGGGGGGDATFASTYPPPSLVAGSTDKGAGGGGGAGALTIYALGDIVIGPAGRIEAVGGHGSGGENTNYVNRIGGGSGGGSGGHIILQTASQIDLSLVPTNVVAISARGGQGGAGRENQGGADDQETGAAVDAKHVGVTGPGDLNDNPWIPPVPASCTTTPGVIRAAGGDGGPGIVQMHVGDLPGDIGYPGGGSQTALGGSVKPPPVGYNINANTWVDQLLPAFGRFSTAQSKWIPLGGISIAPDSEVPEPVAFLFEGTDPETGSLLRSGTMVQTLAPILAPGSPIEAVGLPDVDPADPRTLWLDAAQLARADEIYQANPNLLRRFLLRVAGQDFEVEAAGYTESADRLEVTVASVGPTLPTQGLVELIPRFFAITTSGVAGFYPTSSNIVLEFQATLANALGQPDSASVFPGEASPETGGWARDITVLNVPENADFRFLRWRATFDIQADGGGLTGNTPRPAFEFLRVPFRF